MEPTVDVEFSEFVRKYEVCVMIMICSACVQLMAANYTLTAVKLKHWT